MEREKIQRVIEELKSIFDIPHDLTIGQISSLQTAIACMEKQLPKAPEHKVHEKYPTLGKNYYCSCGVMFVDFKRNGTNYCGNCGQKLKEETE